MLNEVNIPKIIEQYEIENNITFSESEKTHFSNIIKKIDEICNCNDVVYDETLGLFI